MKKCPICELNYIDDEQESCKICNSESNTNLAGKKVYAILTHMDEPLVFNIGNSLEVIEAIETLKGNGPSDLVEVCYEIGMLLMEAAGIAKGEEAKALMIEKINNGEIGKLL